MLTLSFRIIIAHVNATRENGGNDVEVQEEGSFSFSMCGHWSVLPLFINHFTGCFQFQTSIKRRCKLLEYAAPQVDEASSISKNSNKLHSHAVQNFTFYSSTDSINNKKPSAYCDVLEVFLFKKQFNKMSK